MLAELILTTALLGDLKIVKPVIPATPHSLVELSEIAKMAILDYDSRAASGSNDAAVISLETLRGLPFVDNVSVRPAAAKPRKQIVHFLDWHHVSLPDFEKDAAATFGRPLGQSELSQRYAQFLLNLRAIQIEQTAALICLRNHGLRSIYLEGLTREKMTMWRKSVDALRESLLAARGLRELAADDEAAIAEMVEREATQTEDYKELIAGWARRQRLLADHEEAALALGPVGTIEAGGLVDAVPLDDDKILLAAKPTWKGGQLVTQGPANDAREEAVVKRLLADKSPIVFVLLGGGHDLGKWLAVPDRVDVEYIRVTCRAYKRVVDG